MFYQCLISKRFVGTLLLSSALSTPVQAGSLDGQYIQLGAGWSSNVNSLSQASDANSTASLNGKMRQTTFNGLASIGYSQDLGVVSKSLGGFNLGLNAFMLIGNQKAGQGSSTGLSNDGSYSATLTGNALLKNTWGLSLEPGVYVAENTLGYIKLAYLNTQGQTNINYADSAGNGAALKANRTLSGYGLGVGVKQKFSEHIFAGFDVLGSCYEKLSGEESGTSKFSQMISMLSVGYRF